ncbi:lipopolysaccharide assembly protein LapA domain-containing protein [Fontimonas sp. SYSU GA230001]|uniref:lipopolysaccharide assembly protein LapA domain-containing protein n=1 Tax=Fontimonas sp. SYSU GA230001 TaxID=3142450 RepID=UPI0032B5ADBA
MSRIVLMGGLILVLVLGAAIGYFNAQPVHFDYLVGVLELPLIAVLILAFCAGVVVALLVVGARLLSLRLELRRSARQLRELEIELRNLRNLPVTTETGASQ